VQNFVWTREKPLEIAILISGRGSNMEAILQKIQSGALERVKCALVLADREDAKGLEIARSSGIPAEFLDPGPKKTFLTPEAEKKWVERIRRSGAQLICLAGFMRVLKTDFMDAFAGRILNIHPSLLPKFPGLHVQKRALEAGEAEAGCTVHWVDRGVDSGPILGQRKVPIRPDDTEETLSARILKEEHILYSEVLSGISIGEIPIPAIR